MQKIKIVKADNCTIPGITIEISGEIPELDPKKEDEFYDNEADKIVDALVKTLPGAVIDGVIEKFSELFINLSDWEGEK